RGRSRRMESSIVVDDGDGVILVDATRDFARQAVGRVDVVLLTHAHRDACGGIRALDRALTSRVPVYAARSTIDAIRARGRELVHLELHARSRLAWRAWRITAIVVPHARDCTTFAWKLARPGCTLVYASDVARLTPRLRAFCAGCDLLVLDGATWRR